MKKTHITPIVTFLFVVSIILTILSSSTVYAKYSGGAGTVFDPYQIAKASDLLALASNTNDYGAYFILTADIDLSGHSFTTAVIAPDTSESDPGFQGITFTGVFNGNGHLISNLTINNANAGNSCLGLFGELEGGEIDNLRLINITITSGDSSSEVGGLVGENRGFIGHCSSTGTITCGSSSSQVGGLVGYSAFAAISGCYSICDITGGNNASQLGGLAGCSWGGSISNSYSMGNITCGDNSDSLGGLIGENMMSSIIINSFATGNVVGGFDSQTVGGLVGYNNMSGAISSCYATGVATGTNSVGGLMGYNWGDLSNCYATGAVTGTDSVGGLVGYYSYGSTKNCYSTGNVSGTSYVGGLLGHFSSGSVSHCYFLDSSGPDNSPPGAPLSNAKMKQQASFVGWDFVGETANGTEDIWLINEGVDYPKLNLPPIASVIVKFGSFDGKKNFPLTLTDCDMNSVKFSLTGGGYGEIDPTDCKFPTVTLYDTTDKSALTISTKSKAWTKVGSIICNGPMKSITAKTTELSGSVKIGPSSNPKTAVTIVFDRADELDIDSNMPIKSLSASDWWGGSLVAPSVGSITITAKKTPRRYGDLQPDVTVTGVINSVKVAGEISASWDCNSVKSITTSWLGFFHMTLSQKPDARIPSLGALTVKNSIYFGQILSKGNIGTVNAGDLSNSNCFAGVNGAIMKDENTDDVLDLPVADAANFDATATIKNITIKGIKGEPNSVVNSNIAAANILSASLAYPLTANNGVTFGLAADYIKKLTIKGAAGTKTYKELDKPVADSKKDGDFQIRLY